MAVHIHIESVTMLKFIYPVCFFNINYSIFTQKKILFNKSFKNQSLIFFIKIYKSVCVCANPYYGNIKKNAFAKNIFSHSQKWKKKKRIILEKSYLEKWKIYSHTFRWTFSIMNICVAIENTITTTSIANIISSMVNGCVLCICTFKYCPQTDNNKNIFSWLYYYNVIGCEVISFFRTK